METQRDALTAEDRYRRAAGRVFRALRNRKDWSLRDFGEHVGAAHTSLYAVERGETTPGIDVLDRVAGAFDMSLSALLSMIVDELHQEADSPDDSLTDLVVTFSRLTPDQRAEVLTYVDYLKYRDERRTD